MCVILSKIFIIFGLGMSFSGLICLIESKTIRQNGRKFDSHVVTKPSLNSVAWVLTIIGYLCQIVGVIFA